jgi:hypothetical protein
MSARAPGLLPAMLVADPQDRPQAPGSSGFRPDGILVAYATFAHAANTGALADVVGAKPVT